MRSHRSGSNEFGRNCTRNGISSFPSSRNCVPSFKAQFKAKKKKTFNCIKFSHGDWSWRKILKKRTGTAITKWITKVDKKKNEGRNEEKGGRRKKSEIEIKRILRSGKGSLLTCDAFSAFLDASFRVWVILSRSHCQTKLCWRVPWEKRAFLSPFEEKEEPRFPVECPACNKDRWNLQKQIFVLLFKYYRFYFIQNFQKIKVEWKKLQGFKNNKNSVRWE